MPQIKTRTIKEKDEQYVCVCGHINEKEYQAASKIRNQHLKKMHKKGWKTKIAIIDDKIVGFIHVIPIEISPWGPSGKDLMFVPCLDVSNKYKGNGVGKALVEAAIKEAKKRGTKGVTTIGYYNDSIFMPAEFFEKLHFTVVDRKGESAILWIIFDESAEEPTFFEPTYEYTPIEGSVVIDLFWNSFCLTSVTEALNVKEVAQEFKNEVVLREYNIDDREILLQYQLPHGIFINGKEIYWGYAAPKKGIRKAILKELHSD
ncbi:MAG: GNAT family N-acetyltransferase [Candidatus Methanofastidiosia archaeon]|jgi:predicted N-acetyltransferase YhbS